MTSRTPDKFRSLVDKTRRLFEFNYPRAFDSRKQAKRPLVAGVRENLIATLPHVKRFAIIVALDDYCTGPTYLRQLVAGTPRIDLQGREVAIVEPHHEAHARATMARLWPQLPERLMTMANGSPIHGVSALPPKRPLIAHPPRAGKSEVIARYAAERRPLDYGREMPCREVIPGMARLEHDSYEFCH